MRDREWGQDLQCFLCFALSRPYIPYVGRICAFSKKSVFNSFLTK